MVEVPFGLRLFGLSAAGVRRVRYKDLLRLMEFAERQGGLAHGNRGWLEDHSDEAEIFYLVRLPRRDHRGFVKCALVVMGKMNRGVWMNLDVRRRSYSRLPRVSNLEMENLMLNLAVRLPNVRMAEDSMFDPDVDFD